MTIEPVPCRDELAGIFGNHAFVIADIGCCDGTSTIEYLHAFPAATAVCFEARVDNVGETLANFENHKDITRDRIIAVHQAVLAERKKPVTLHESYGSPPGQNVDWRMSSSIFAPTGHKTAHPWCKFRKVHAETTTLDSFGYRNIDFIHIDVQGAEVAVFRGGAETMKTVRAIWCEVSNRQLYAGQPLKHQVERYLGSLGFRKTIDTSGKAWQGDQFWVR